MLTGEETTGGGAPSASSSGHAEEDKTKAERLAKIQAWKKKQVEERERKQKELDAVGGTRGLLDAMDRRETASPATASPLSPATPDRTTSPAAYPGKFDPKAIAKKATAVSAPTKSALGKDVALPDSAKTWYKVFRSGFGLGSKGAFEPDKASGKRPLNFGDEESTRKKLEKLPTPPLEDANGVEDALPANDVEEDDDVDMQDGGTEEETAAAARAAAEKREERLQSQTVEPDSTPSLVPNGQVDQAMLDRPPLAPTVPAVAEPMVRADEEEIDPLDAFMTGLGDPMADPPPTNGTGKSSSGVKKQSQPEALFGDDDVNLDAIDADPDDILAMASKKKKKDLPAIDHKKINYLPFRKKFYTEPAELSEMTEEELADLRLELDGIKIRGVDVPKPVQKWSQCGLGVQTLEVIQRLGYERPTSIQTQAIPAIMSGRDVIGVAKTGSGKTIAFLLPMFRHIKDQRPLESLDGPVGLVMTPTRELATQIHKECKPFLKALNLRAVCAYGGAPIKDQIADLKRGAEIIVCTPGRMIDLLAANSGRVTNLRRVTYVVLDEADRMFDMGFEPQVMKIIGNIRPDKQTVLFSATFPRQMEALARKTLQKPVEIVVGGRSVVAPEITQMVEVRAEESKFLRLLELLGELYDTDEDARTLIFVDRQESADGLLRDLMRKGYPCMSIHGGKDQIDRDSTINDFKAGVVPIMIATSVAARGLDVKQLKLVVNFDAPNHLEDYVHRAGRTGRAGNTGTAVTFLTEEQERYSIDIAKALRQSDQRVPDAVQKMVDSFLEKVKAGKEKASGSGFGGKGLERLDQERDAARNRERKTYKTGDDGEEDEKEDKKEDEIVVKASSSVAPAPPMSIPGVPKGIDLDGKITVHRTEVAPTASGSSKNPLDRVGQAVADINSRLNKTGQLRSGVPIDNKGPDAGAFHATLEINDFPQKARWAVTNRTNVAKILEATGTSITTKGSFYATGKEPQLGENPKLYILVEGDTEVVVTNAMRELMRLLKEGTVAAADSEARAPASGRYNVV
ncbi:MAG: pre-mRNA processing RNA-helicase [Thelocarpon superellum]|nr:MAG: pre-mRNA processing RNA-helicase [Thelocarpon superellum]